MTVRPMKRYWLLVAAGLAFAMILFVAFSGRTRKTPQINDLAAALGDHRFIEPRLTGGFAFASCRTEQRADRLLPEVICSNPSSRRDSRKVIRNFLSSLGDSDFHARGVALLVGADGPKMINEAVYSLEMAAVRGPANARILNDLAAAYMVRFQEGDETEDLARALNTSARAHAIDPALPEAAFNLALSQERLFLSRSALASWSRAWKLEIGSPWGQEIEVHIRGLGKKFGPISRTILIAEMDREALKGDKEAIRRSVQASPQIAREYAIEDLLGEWGECYLNGDRRSASQLLQKVGVLGAGLLSVHSDPTVKNAVATVQRRLAERPDGLQGLARGHIAFRDAMKDFKALATQVAGSRFAIAERELESSGSPIALWARVGRARVLAYEGSYDQAEGILNQVLLQARSKGFVVLSGWTKWGLGWLGLRRGRLGDAFSFYRSAAIDYKVAGEHENLGALEGLIADSLFVLGQYPTAWKYRHRALAALVRFPESFRLHNVLSEGARSAREEGLAEAALNLQSEDLLVSRETGNQIQITEALWTRAKILLDLGRPDEAMADLRAAGTALKAVEQALPPQENSAIAKLKADLRLVEGLALTGTNPEAAQESFAQAIDAYERLGASPSLIQAFLGRARLHLQGDEDAKADQDLEAALRLIEGASSLLTNKDLLASYRQPIQKVYDEMIIHKVLNGRPEEALSLLERARGFVVPERGLHPGREDIAVVNYGVVDGHLLTWIFVRGKSTFLDRPIKTEVLAGLVDRFIGGIRDPGGPDAKWEGESGNLYRLLLPESIHLPRESPVYFVPDKFLREVPFAALRDPMSGRFLIEDHPVAVSPSLSILADTVADEPSEANPSTPSVLLVSHPAIDRTVFPDLTDLPGSDLEAEAILGSFKSFSWMKGSEATAGRLRQEMDRFDIFVYIGHAISDMGPLARAGLVLAPGPGRLDSGLAFTDELTGGKLRKLRVVVLSACNQLDADEKRTGSLFGIAQAFIEAGASTVVGPVWEVEDGSSSSLMPSFYEGLARGQPALVALREAQLKLIASAKGDPKNVHAWSSFEVINYSSVRIGAKGGS